MKNRILRYQISDWSQITQCKSNNSKNFSISLSKILDGEKLRGLVLRVNHTNYGPVFAAMVSGSGNLITDVDEYGLELPFLTTNEVLKQIKKFGFYVVYDVKKDLPAPTLVYLVQVNELGYDKITRVAVEGRDSIGHKIWKPTIIVMKSEFNHDLLVFDCKVTRKVFNEKLEANSLINVTHEPNTQWDWVSYIANITDILNENVDSPNELTLVEEVEPITVAPKEYVEYGKSAPDSYTEYVAYTEYDESAGTANLFEGTVYANSIQEEQPGLEG